MQKKPTFKIAFEVNKVWAVVCLSIIVMTLAGVVFFVNRGGQPVALASSKIVLFREQGEVKIKNPSKGINDFQSVTAEETEIFENTTIKTENAIAHVVLPDSSLMSLDKYSEIKIQVASEQKSVFLQIAGNTWHRVKEIINPSEDRYQVITPNAVAAVRGTEFGVELVDKIDDSSNTDPSRLESRISLVEGKLAISKKINNESDINKIVKNKEYVLNSGQVAVVDEDTESPIISPIPDEIKNSDYFKRNTTISEGILHNTKQLEKNEQATFLKEIWTNSDLIDLKTTEQPEEVAKASGRLADYNKKIREILASRNIPLDEVEDNSDDTGEDQIIAAKPNNPSEKRDSKNAFLSSNEPKDNKKSEDEKQKKTGSDQKFRDLADLLYFKLSKVNVIKQEKIRVKTDIFKTQREVNLINNKISELQRRIASIDTELTVEKNPNKRYSLILEKKSSNTLILNLKQALEYRQRDLNVKNTQLATLDAQQNELEAQIEQGITELNSVDKIPYQNQLNEAKKDDQIVEPVNDPIDPGLSNLLGGSSFSLPNTVLDSVTTSPINSVVTQ